MIFFPKLDISKGKIIKIYGLPLALNVDMKGYGDISSILIVISNLNLVVNTSGIKS